MTPIRHASAFSACLWLAAGAFARGSGDVEMLAIQRAPAASARAVEAPRNLPASSPPPRPAASPRFAILVRFPADADRAPATFALGRDVLLQVRRAVDARGLALGWDLAAVDRRIPGSPNFFYDCLCGHGPRPHDYYAWHFVQPLYPHDRILPVYGYPLEVRVSCDDCEVSGEGEEVHFVGGTVEIGWRRLSAANPRQTRVGEA